MTAYAMYFNKKYNRTGHVFQGRYKGIIVDKDNYLLQVNRYIHLNPIKQKLVFKPEDYFWSSYKCYLNRNNCLVKLNTAEVLEMFSQKPSKQVKLFKEFTLAKAEEDFNPFKLQKRGVLGRGKFRQKLTKVFKGTRL